MRPAIPRSRAAISGFERGSSVELQPCQNEWREAKPPGPNAPEICAVRLGVQASIRTVEGEIEDSAGPRDLSVSALRRIVRPRASEIDDEIPERSEHDRPVRERMLDRSLNSPAIAASPAVFCRLECALRRSSAV
jgi:hypothetical protein